MLKHQHTRDNRLHTHTEYEMLVNLMGDEQVIVEKNIYPVTRGDVILVHPYEHHHCIMRSEKKHELFWILIDARSDNPIAKYISELRSSYYSPSSEDREALIKLCYELLNESCESLDALRILLQILSLLKKSSSIGNAQQNTLPAELNDALTYFDAHLTEDLCIKSVGRTLGLSESTLTRRFREYLEASPLEYLKKKRMIK